MTVFFSEPGTVNRSEIITAPEAYKINLTWKPPCFSNGDIIYYNISWCNKNKASDKGSNVSQTAQLMFTNVLPYRNYTFKIAAVNNRSQGQYSEECKVQSKIAGKKCIYTHEKKLGNTSCFMRVNFGLPFFYI